jgi:hypothetical protein
MRRGSANFIGARSGRTGCNKAGYRAAAHPVCRNTRKLLQTGRVHIANHELQTGCINRTGHDSVSLFYWQRTGSTRLRARRLAQCLGAMPLCRSRDCSIGSGGLRRACGSRFELCLPAWILAWPVGALPQHALPWPVAKRDVSVTRQRRSRTSRAFYRRIRLARMPFNSNGGSLSDPHAFSPGSPLRKPDAYNRPQAAVHLYWVDRH